MTSIQDTFQMYIWQSVIDRLQNHQGVGGNVKDFEAFFISHAFVGVFQNDPGPPKHALEFRDCVKYMFSFFISLFIMGPPRSKRLQKGPLFCPPPLDFENILQLDLFNWFGRFLKEGILVAIATTLAWIQVQQLCRHLQYCPLLSLVSMWPAEERGVMGDKGGYCISPTFRTSFTWGSI